MSHTRSSLKVIGYERDTNGNRTYSPWLAPSISIGEWHAHLPIETAQGVVISHRSGLQAVACLTPIQAVRCLRALAQLPPCPMDDQAHRLAVRDGRTREYPSLRAWLVGVRGVVAAYKVETATV